MKARIEIATTIIALVMANFSSAQTESWSWVRQDHILNSSGLEVGNFNAQFDVLDWNGDGLWDFVVNDSITPRLFVGVDPLPSARWQNQPIIFPALEPNYLTYDPPLSFQFVDFDHDGDFDLAADGGQFWWNTGTNNNPSWQKDDSVLFDIREQLICAFVDYDNDGDYDATASGFNYSELYWNTDGGSRPRWVADTSEVSSPLDDENLLTYAVYHDVDGDGDLDLLALRNAVADPFTFYITFLYKNEATLLNPVWVEQELGLNCPCEIREPPSYEVVDFDLDTDVDFLVRNSFRHFSFFENTAGIDSIIFKCESHQEWGAVNGASKVIPILFDDRHDGAPDLILSEDYWDSFGLTTYREGRVFSFANENDGFDINNPNNFWFKNPYPVQIHNFAIRFHLNFTDFDRDGDQDYLFSYYKTTLLNDDVTGSRVIFYGNDGTDASPDWIADNNLFAQFDQSPQRFWAPNLIDIDSDGDDDLFVKRGEHFAFYEQIAAGPPLQWQEQKSFTSGISDSSHYLAVFADLTRDGLPDLIFGEDDGTLSFYENIGGSRQPAWLHHPQTFANIDVGELAAPAFGDMDHDGRLDMFLGSADGRLLFYRNESTVGVEETPHDRPLVFELSNNYPNPFAAQNGAFATAFDFHLPRASRVRVRIYNLLGHEIRTLLDDDLKSGRHHMHWVGRDHRGQIVGAGIYLVSLRAGDFVQARKLTLIR